MKAARFESKGGELQVVEVPIPVPNSHQVRLKVLCCGVCHGDVVVQHSAMGNSFPRIPGHEVAGIVDEVGKEVKYFHKGDYVGVGWFGGICNDCEGCRGSRWERCVKRLTCGSNYDGGYAEYMVVPWEALAKLPVDLKPEEAGPLMCAGVTTFNSLRHSGAIGGDLVVIQGLGGLGHLGVQFARKLGFHTVAVSRGSDKAELAKKLGAHVFIDTEKQDAVKEILALGGAKIVLGTAPDAKAIEQLVPALGYGGRFILVGAITTPVQLNTLPMLFQRQTFGAWNSGDSRDSEDTAKFSFLQDVKPMVELFPLEKAAEAYKQMLTNKVRFRAVIKIADRK